jgi:hypothetical protein
MPAFKGENFALASPPELVLDGGRELKIRWEALP